MTVDPWLIIFLAVIVLVTYAGLRLIQRWIK